MVAMRYPKLFTPGRIGTLQIPNRILMGSMHLGYEGVPGGTGRMAEFYAARARGGAALIITGGCAINAEAIGGAQFSCIYRDEDLEALRHVASAVHDAGGRIGLQLFHAGRYATREWLSGLQPVAPSPIRCVLHAATPREMTEDDIVRTIADFATAARRAQEAGFDCVEVMGSEGYLINQFFSPLTNRREDRWGGPVKHRARFSVEVLRAIRATCGDSLPIIFRMSGIDLMPGSSSWDETFYWARELEREGADALNIGIGWHESRIPTISLLVPRKHYSFVSERIKKRVGIPCISSNRINDPETAEDILASGQADFVSMARALLADADLPEKAASGRSALVNTCIACNQACLDNAFRGEPTACILNPEAGREQEMKLQPAAYRKKVAVVGAGPAGLEAARVLALRGHRVTVFEKRGRAGGQLVHAASVPGKQEFLNTIRYFESYLKEYAVVLELNTMGDVATLKAYDAVVVATGARPRLPDIPGAQLGLCMDYDRYFESPGSAGARVVIMGAGGIGCDAAHLLADGVESYPPSAFFDDTNHVSAYEEYLRSLPRQRSITLTRRGKRIGEKLGPTTRWAMMQLLENRGVQMLTQVQYEEITESGLKLHTRAGKEIFLDADTIILATGQEPDNSLHTLLKDQVGECYLVGAAHTASETNAQSAILEASQAARKI